MHGVCGGCNLCSSCLLRAFCTNVTHFSATIASLFATGAACAGALSVGRRIGAVAREMAGFVTIVASGLLRAVARHVARLATGVASATTAAIATAIATTSATTATVAVATTAARAVRARACDVALLATLVALRSAAAAVAAAAAAPNASSAGAVARNVPLATAVVARLGLGRCRAVARHVAGFATVEAFRIASIWAIASLMAWLTTCVARS